MATIARKAWTPPPVEVISNPEIMGGWPCVSGTRIPAETILLYIKDGAGIHEIVTDYPTLPLGFRDAVIAWAEATGRM